MLNLLVHHLTNKLEKVKTCPMSVVGAVDKLGVMTVWWWNCDCLNWTVE